MIVLHPAAASVLHCGLLSYLLSIHSADIFAVHPLKGSVFETFVYSELLKVFFNTARRSELYFWRDKTGHEIDFIAPQADTLISIEVKAGRTINADYFKNIKYLAALSPSTHPLVIYNGSQEQSSQLLYRTDKLHHLSSYSAINSSILSLI